jgi:hypothetical protein
VTVSPWIVPETMELAPNVAAASTPLRARCVSLSPGVGPPRLRFEEPKIASLLAP